MHKVDVTLTTYLEEINSIALLTREEEVELSRKALLGDSAARKRLIEANLRFVVNVAKKYQNQGLPLEDLISEGNIGLMNAIERFNPERGYHFISYAVWWIRQAILKAIYEKSRMIRLPLNRINELIRLGKVRKVLLEDSGEEPSIAELASKTGISEKDIKNIKSISRDLVSLDTPVCDEQHSATLGDFVVDEASTSPEKKVLHTALKDDVEAVLATLSPKESDILRHRFGLSERKPLSLKDVGERYGLTKERIRQLETKALQRLRHPSRRQYLKDYVAA